MSDFAHERTDELLAVLEKRIAEIYSAASREINEEVIAYFAKFVKRDEEMREKVENGEVTEHDYQQWRLAQMGRGKRMETLRDQLAERMTNANEVAASYINDATPGVYSLNRNYAAYTIEQVAGDVGFTLWDESTVRRLIVENPGLMPYYPPKRAVDRGIDLAWGKQQITRQVTSGILQGESVGKIANRLQKNIPDMNRTSAIRAARTAMTAAQNGGRMDSFMQAAAMGIDMEREWLATLDNRTRHAHAMLDGQRAPLDKPFKVDGHEIMFPGDMSAAPYLVYNCRCTLVGAIKDIDTSDAKRRARDPATGQNELISDMSYQEWEKWKKSVNKKKLENSVKNGIMKVRNMSNIYTQGKRNEAPLSEEQKLRAREAAIRQGYDGEIIFSDNSFTSFHGSVEGDPFHFLVIGTDAYPASENGGTANEMISVDGCMAHEIVGHYGAWKKGTAQGEVVLEEAQASIRAAKFGIDLTVEEREILWQDALDRLTQSGLNFDEIKDSLDIWES